MKREANIKSFALDFTKASPSKSILKVTGRQTDDHLTPTNRTQRVPQIVLTKTMVFSKYEYKDAKLDALTDSEQSKSSDLWHEKPYSFF